MSNNLPVNFPLQSEGAITSYNWTEMLSGMGYLTLYPATCHPDNILVSAPISIGTGISQSFWTNIAITFDTSPLMLSQVINGYVIGTFPVQSSSTAGNRSITFTVNKVDISAGVTELLSLHTGTCAPSFVGSLAGSGYLTNTIIKAGEKIRLIVTIPQYLWASFDPAGDTWTYTFGTNTKGDSNLHLPIKIDI